LLLLQHHLSGAPAWSAAHGIDVWQLRQGPRRWALQRLQRLLPVSRFTAESLRHQFGRRCPPLTVLPNSVDSGRFHPGPRPPELLRRYGLRPDQPLIFSLSRLSHFDRYKNIHALLEAMPALLQLFPDLQLIIGGDGDDRPHLQALASQLRVGSAVRFVGAIPEAELADHFRLASLFALPSEKEGFGIVFLEALACGTPVLAGNRDGSVDPLQDGRLGLLVDPRQPLAPGLQALLECRGPALWFEPEQLAAATVESFGFAALCQQLDRLLRAFEEADYADPA
jgi:glycosyltransferase involved in cell wall biosynthesis